MKKKITQDHFHDLTRPLIGLPISRAWRGYGSAIFLELGELTQNKWRRKDGTIKIRKGLKGQYTISLNWHWRVELPKSVSFGSSSTNQKITNGVNRLQGLKITELTTEGRLPELVVQLSGKLWIHSFTTEETQPEWGLLFNNEGQNESWIDSANGNLYLIAEDPEK